MFSLSYSSLESKISIGSSTIAPCFVTTLTLLLKMPFYSLSNIGHINSRILSLHQIVALIPISTLLPSSHLDDDSDSKCEITTNDAMLYTNFLAYLSDSSCTFYYFVKKKLCNFFQVYTLFFVLRLFVLLPLLFFEIFQMCSFHSCCNKDCKHKTRMHY